MDTYFQEQCINSYLNYTIKLIFYRLCPNVRECVDVRLIYITYTDIFTDFTANILVYTYMCSWSLLYVITEMAYRQIINHNQ
jgi:hypothetical protein